MKSAVSAVQEATVGHTKKLRRFRYDERKVDWPLSAQRTRGISEQVMQRG